MLTTKEAFDKFKKRLALSDTEKRDAQKRESEVRNVIESEFDVKRSYLSGSYGRDTKTKPLKDVDVIFELDTREYWRRSKPPVDLLVDVEKCLRKVYSKEQVIPGRRCVTVNFEKTNYQEGTDEKILSIDVVPAIPTGKNIELADRETGNWVLSNPQTHADKATAKNKQLDDKWKPLVKMLKAWNRNAGKPIKPSFLVEVMALELVQPAFSDYASEARNFFASASNSIGQTWGDPAGLGPPVSEQMTPAMIKNAQAALSEAERKAAVAFRLDATNRQGDALQMWQDIFGPLFSKT